MAHHTSSVPNWRRSAGKLWAPIERTWDQSLGKVLNPVIYRMGVVLRSIWDNPLLIFGVLLILTIAIFYLITTQAFAGLFNCERLLGKWICNGPSFELPLGKIFGQNITVPLFPAVKGFLDAHVFEPIRQFVVWAIVIFFVLGSLILTLIINAIIRTTKRVIHTVNLLIKYDAVRKQYLAFINTWLLIFVSLCVVFYFSVVR